ncbi:ferric reductase-like transmembrane domain-containing protein [Acaryochloris sp. CCMEE 5410]|uniref:ferric reductase-like transmembrane domain-containing protein n=1 Tax=Acaryochloris sp. CCMEE 5410 TaxID=310037 RepID=UPI0002484CFB|nr:ferric reductase-like transmembrane domain-containing protein [Acaryochloris sp. CCMEE 5410]KAI9135442.1 ferric reductase-like transmembrane domain-containing protein [Acaryochloris sp. CCMEE 5410]
MFRLDYPPLANWAGFSAALLYVVTLLPTILRVVFPSTKTTGIPKKLLIQRRLLGIIAFLLSVIHGYWMVSKRELDFLDIQTYWIYCQGIFTFLIFTLLAITSNDWSVKKLKKSWKKLHKLTYLAMFLLLWHVIDKMWGHWTWVTPPSLLITGIITALFVIRVIRENYVLDKSKAQSSQSKAPEATASKKD